MVHEEHERVTTVFYAVGTPLEIYHLCAPFSSSCIFLSYLFHDTRSDAVRKEYESIAIAV